MSTKVCIYLIFILIIQKGKASQIVQCSLRVHSSAQESIVWHPRTLLEATLLTSGCFRCKRKVCLALRPATDPPVLGQALEEFCLSCSGGTSTKRPEGSPAHLFQSRYDYLEYGFAGRAQSTNHMPGNPVISPTTNRRARPE